VEGEAKQKILPRYRTEEHDSRTSLSNVFMSEVHRRKRTEQLLEGARGHIIIIIIIIMVEFRQE
jgi:hypothetical protein